MEEKQQRLRQPRYALVYAAIVPQIQNIGRQHGYAIAVHGSMATDLDILACPWTDEAADGETLVEALKAYLDLVFHPGNLSQGIEKPHGRRAWTFCHDTDDPFCVGGPYIDLSVMPRRSSEEC